MEEHHHDDRAAECQLPPSRGTSRPRAAPMLHQPCQDQEREGGHADSRAAALTAALPGDDGTPDPNPVHHPSSGRVNQPRAAEQLAPPSAAACTAGRKTDGPLSGAAAPGGGGRPEADPAARLPHHSGFNAIHPVTRPATVKSCTTLRRVSHFPGQPRPCEAGKCWLPRTHCTVVCYNPSPIAIPAPLHSCRWSSSSASSRGC